ncbi:MAG: tetratricopeptide repeat protein [Planctomycetes bacterium]|nr:tetratricopeptide repeat protein [Planctomycetota bacterium]
MNSAPDAGTLCREAQMALRHRQYDRAAELFHQALQHDPDLIEAHRGLGTVYFHKEQYDQAVEHFNRWMQIRPLEAAPYINLGAVYTRMGEYQKAADILQRAIQRDSRSFEAYYNLGLAYRKLGQLGMAMNAYREAIRINPDVPDAHQNLANVFLKMGNPRKAIEHYEKALELAPDFERAKRGLEKARDAIAEAPQTVNPFGRLVDEQTLARNVARTEFRELSLEERFADRQALSDLTTEIIAIATEWLEGIRDKLSPALIELHRSVIDEDNRMVFAAYDKYREAIQQHDAVRERLRRSVEKLRQHEDEMKQPPE